MFFVDTDILSAFIKVGGIKYLKQAVPKPICIIQINNISSQLGNY
jgi:hypothetical protein